MSNKFLGSDSSDLTDGTATLYIADLTIEGLEPSLPVKTNATKTLISSKLDIADINGLQTELNAIPNPIEASTGLFSGGILSLGAGGPGVATTFNISAGVGQFVSGGTITQTSWVDYVEASLAYPSGLTYISLAPPLTPGGIPVLEGIQAPLTSSQARDNIIIGVVSSQNNVNLLGFNSNPFFLGNHTSQFRDLCKSLGILNTSGNVIGPSVLLTVSKTIGTIFSIHSNYSVDIDNPNITTVRAFDTNLGGDTYFWSFQDGSLSVQSDIQATQYDDGNGVGSPGVVTSQKWTNMRVFIAVGRIIIMPGQFIWNSEAEAQSMILIEAHVTPVELNDVAVLVAVIVVRGGATDLNLIADAQFVKISAAGGGGGGSVFDQDLNTTSDVEFNSVLVEGTHESCEIKNEPTVLAIKSGDFLTLSQFDVARCAGTIAAPTAAYDGIAISHTSSSSYNGSAYHENCSVVSRATENQTPGNAGCDYLIRSCNNGTDTQTDKFRINSTEVISYLPIVVQESETIIGAAEVQSNFESGEWDFSNNTPGITEVSASSCTFDEVPGKRAINSLYSFKPGDLAVGGYMEVKCTLTSISLSKWVGFGFSFPSCETEYLGHAVGYGNDENFLVANGLSGGAGNLMIGDGVVVHDPTTPSILVVNTDKISVRLTRTSSVLWTLTYELGATPTAINETTTIGPEYEWLDCKTYSATFSEFGNVGFNIASPIISHSLWTPSATNIIEQMDNSNHLEIIGPGSTSLTDSMLTFTPQALEIKNNLQTDGRITSQKSLFGFPVASNVCFYTSTEGVEFAANDASPFELAVGQRQFGNANVPKFNEGNYLKISMRGTLSVATATTASLVLKCYIGTTLICLSDVTDGEIRPNSMDWELDIDIYPKTFSVVNFESINIYGSGMFQTNWSNGSAPDVIKGFSILNNNQNLTPADLGDLRVTAEWNNTTSANDNITMRTCRFEYGGFNT